MSGPLGSSQWMYSSSTGFYDHNIGQSLRINTADSAYLSRANVSGGSTNTMTFSSWVKRVAPGTYHLLWYGKNASSGRYDAIWIGTDDQIQVIFDSTVSGYPKWSAKLRDPSSWYNIVVKFKLDESTSTDRVKLYINGVDQGDAANYPASSATFSAWFVNSQTTYMGFDSGSTYGGGMVADVNVLDGVAAGPDSFGSLKNGIWVPVDTSGLTFGANGFRLEFANTGTATTSEGTTATTNIGDDSSGQGHNFAVTNIEAHDVLIDTPSNNFAVLNPLYHSSSQAVLSEGNLKADTAGFVNAADGYGAVSTFAIPKDKKIYIEVECTDGVGSNWFAGFASQSGLESGPSSTQVGGSNAITVYNRSVYVNGSETDYGSSAGLGGLGVANLASGDILGCMCDGATGKVWFSRNGTYFKSPSTNDSGTTGDPAGGNHEIGTITNGTTEDVFFVLSGNTSVSSIFVNFGQDTVNIASAESDANGIGSFEYAPPTDYVCLCASSLSEPTIGPNTSDTNSDDNFNTVLWSGNSTNSRSITVGHATDLLWIKKRGTTVQSHVIADTVRGTSNNSGTGNVGILASNLTSAESTNSSDSGIASFDSTGFTIGAGSNTANADAPYQGTNASGHTYVGWSWKAGGNSNTFNIDGTGYSSASDASLSGGDITPTGASINTTAGFGIIGYTGNGLADKTIKHGLSSAPEFIIIKDRDSNSNNNQWQISHASVGDDYGYFTSANFTGTAGVFATSGDATTVTIGRTGNNVLNTNESGDDFIMYLFHSVDGFCKIGEYSGNNSTDGPFIYLGFRPRLIWFKRHNSTGGSWRIMDTARDTINVANKRLFIDTTATEDDTRDVLDITSNGFKLRANNAGNNGVTTNRFVFAAWAEAPFKYANAR